MERCSNPAVRYSDHLGHPGTYYIHPLPDQKKKIETFSKSNLANPLPVRAYIRYFHVRFYFQRNDVASQSSGNIDRETSL